MIHVRLYPYSAQLAAIKAEFANLLSKAGGVMAGTIDMDGHAITGLPETVPGSGGAAISKAVLDLAIAGRIGAEAGIAADVAALASTVAGKATAAQGAKADSAVQPGADVSVLAETSTAKIMTSAERTKLAGVAVGATVNQTDATLKNRANHSGAQPIDSVTGLQGALDGKATAAQGSKADTALQPNAPISSISGLETAIANIVEAESQSQGRPGDAIMRFAGSLTGAAPIAPPAPGTIAITDDAGAVQRITGAAIIGTRERIALDPARKYRVRLSLIRAFDPSDPSGDTIRFGIQWLNKNKAQISQRIIADVTATVATGRIVQDVVVAASAGSDVDYAWPATARYMVPFVQTYGSDGVSDVQWIEWTDVTEVASKVDPADLAAIATSGSAADLDEAADAKVMTADERAGLVIVRGTVDVGLPSGFVDRFGLYMLDFEGGPDANAPRVGALDIGGAFVTYDGATIDFDGKWLRSGGLAMQTSSLVDGGASSFELGDRFGFSVLTADGGPNGDAVCVGGGFGIDGLFFEQVEDGDSMVDRFGIARPIMLAGDELDGPLATSVSLCARDAVNLALSAQIAREINTTQQPLVRNAVNIFVVYGQSLSRGQECWPALSRAPRADGNIFSLGLSTRPSGQTSSTFDPVDDGNPVNAGLNPMISVVHVNNVLPSDATISAYAPGYNVPGEGPEVGAINFLRQAYLDHHGIVADPESPWVVISCGVGGQSIAALSKPTNPAQISTSYYNRVLDGLAKVMACPEFGGMDFRVPAVLWLQGEEDYVNGTSSPTPSAAQYLAALLQLRDDLNADISALTATHSANGGQTKPAAFVTYQTSGYNSRDALDMFVGNAQLQAATQNVGLHMAAASYPVTDKGVHLDSNGSRWLGMQFGKVLSRILLRKEGWQPLHPRRATISGMEVLIDFHVPSAPLQWSVPYDQLVATDYASKGFVVRDNQGDIALSAEIVGQTIVRLSLARVPVGTVHVEGGTFRGSEGNLCLTDSDATIATELYEYAAGTGQYSAAAVPALVDKPYPLENWCVNFSIIPEAI